MSQLLDLAVRGGTIATADSYFTADLGVQDGRIVQIGGELQAVAEIDAAGKLVLPGGIDMHVHLTPVELADTTLHFADDFSSGSRAAAAGGVTTIGNMTHASPGELLGSALERAAVEGARDSIVDFVLHPVLLDPTPEALAEIPELGARGQPSLKIFMINGDFDARAHEYLQAMRLAGQNGILTLIHCEDACVIGHQAQKLTAAGRTDISNFPAKSPIYGEEIAVARAVAFCQAAEAPIYIVHLSSRDALAVTRRAQARGLPVYVETRPIYLYFTEEKFSGPEAALYVSNPPLRTGEDVAALWAGLASGTIQTCCTDHASWTREQKLGAATIADERPGMSDLETLMPLLFSEGVRKGRISLQRFVEITSTNAAKLFGLFPRKGTIGIGSDADMTIWDPEASRVVRGAEGVSQAGYSLYDGWEVVGWPSHTISRGEVVFADGKIAADGGRGKWLLRAQS